MTVPALLDLTSILVVQKESAKVILDGRNRRKPSAFAVEVHSDAFADGKRKCFLKTVGAQYFLLFIDPDCPEFTSDPANTLNFNNECKVNHALNVHAAETLLGDRNGPQPANPLESQMRLESLGLPFPLCYGYLTVPDPFFQPPRTAPKAKGKVASPPMVHALLFQLYEDICLLDKEDLDDAGTMEDKLFRALGVIHAAGVYHRDLEDRAAWPEAKFHNIYLTDAGEIVVLDFDHAQIMRTSKELGRLVEEAEQIRELVKSAKEQRGRERGWGLSKEVRRLV
ncbi:hypothetical protein MKEN_01012900 [Mycena kentingensis (nom. inval.)]|nr:hypothetical protein MKEN_01012900 [Mycena kentingensis (nom. inval.)]